MPMANEFWERGSLDGEPVAGFLGRTDRGAIVRMLNDDKWLVPYLNGHEAVKITPLQIVVNR